MEEQAAAIPARKRCGREWGAGLAILALICLAYIPVYQAGFIWDDAEHFTANPRLIGFGLKDVWQRHIFYYPLTETVWWAARRLWDLQPFYYHLLNVFLHALNAILLWCLLRRLRVPGAWVAAALWGLHPVQVESVAWCTELKNCLSGAFYLAALLAWTDYESENRRPSFLAYTATLLFFILAVLSKTSTVVLVAILPLVTLRLGGRVGGRKILGWIPFLAVAAAASWLTIRGQASMSTGIEWQVSTAERILLAGRAFWFYLGKLVWPAELTFIYPQWTPVGTIEPWLWLLAAACFGLVGIACVVLVTGWRRLRPTALAVLYFFFALAPVLGFFKIYYQQYSWVADHWQYLASMGALAWTVGVTAGFLGRTGSSPFYRYACRFTAAGLLLAAGILTFRQAEHYQNNETLWTDTLTKNPSAWMAYNNLGKELLEQGRLREAELQFEQGLRIKPDHYGMHLNLGDIYLGLGDLDRAEAFYREALRLNPNFAEAHNGLGLVLKRSGRIEEAIRSFQTAVLLEPGTAKFRSNLGGAYQQMGEFDEAIRHYEEALDLQPGLAGVHVNLGNAFALQERFEEAVEHYHRALDLEPGFELAHENLERVLRHRDAS